MMSKDYFFPRITWRNNDALANLKCAEDTRQTERMRIFFWHPTSQQYLEGQIPNKFCSFSTANSHSRSVWGSSSCQGNNWLIFWVKFYKFSAKVPQIVLFLASKVLPDDDERKGVLSLDNVQAEDQPLRWLMFSRNALSIKLLGALSPTCFC